MGGGHGSWSRAPLAPLRPYVALLWAHAAEPGAPTERVLPMGTAQLLVPVHTSDTRWSALGGPAQSLCGATIAGPFARAIEVDTAPMRGLVGAVFTPWGAARLTGLSAEVLGNDCVPADALQHEALRHLPEQLAAEANGFARIERLEQALLRCLPPSPQLGPLPWMTETLARGARVRRVAGELGWSERRLRRVFRASVGLSPKRYGRIHRLHRVLDVAAGGAGWAEVAATCGFTDQAHLVHDFRDLTGLRPSEYRPHPTRGPRHA